MKYIKIVLCCGFAVSPVMLRDMAGVVDNIVFRPIALWLGEQSSINKFTLWMKFFTYCRF